MITNRFDVSRLKGKLGQMRDWLLSKNLPFKLIFIIMGIASTVWFLIRVIPKPSRATYPCMQVAAPFMSGFVTYLLAVGGLTAISRRFNKKINVRFGAAVLLLTGVMIAMAVTPSSNMQTATQNGQVKLGPDDGPNQPMGEAKGIFPGRVVLNLPVKRMLRKHGSLFFVYSIQISTTRKGVTRLEKKYLLKSTRDSRDGCLFRKTRIMVFTCQKHLKQVSREEQPILYQLNKVLMLYLKYSGN
jgi:hypothetical protein